ncbi:calcineurin-like phosphoesterase C-terminal domain-containing protein [Pontibacter flavimaris]|uniref:Metallophosphoesterase n=1 Tax=Pontibacter flavimaris TaxID=1797110 RepID=A0A1Q5PD31_9BACT|nr:calcineurin-like phosphoesterase family protein [Pontibacter flavimaris]OKL40124.1 metallophosphoesterase [Pontibacter flavimaris]
MKRRKFLHSVLLLSGGLILSAEAAFGLTTTVKNKVKGTVKARGKGLANVSVSDGYQVVQTNARGKYKLPVNSQAEFVFITIPAGYALPNENGIVKHYQRISESNNRYDFELEALQQDDTNHKFIVWADPQVKNQEDVRQMLTQAVPDVQQLVQAFGAGALVHGITVGDIVWDEHALFQNYNEAVAGTSVPFFQVLGNHDMDLNQGGDEVSDRTFKKLYGPTYYSFNRGKVHYVVLDDVRYSGKGKTYDGHVSKQQLDWLEKDLAFVPKDHLVVLSAHIPVHRGVENKQELLDVLKGYQVHIMTGHTHYNQNIVADGVYEHIHGTLCGAWWTGPVCSDGAPRGYGVYEVNGTDLSWYYKSTGLEKEHQLSVHVEEQQGQKSMLANVWNWDPEWKVEWWADGSYMGTLENSVGYDPVAYALYFGKGLPDKRGFAEPRETEHLFKAPLVPGMKTVKVVAIDRFGNKYEQSADVEIS